MRFEDCFISGLLVRYEVTLEELREIRGGAQKVLAYVFEHLRETARYKLHGHLRPTDKQREAYMDQLMAMRPWEDKPPVPWKDWRLEPLPEPVFTNIRRSERESLIITQVYGGVLNAEILNRQAEEGGPCEGLQRPARGQVCVRSHE